MANSRQPKISNNYVCQDVNLNLAAQIASALEKVRLAVIKIARPKVMDPSTSDDWLKFVIDSTLMLGNVHERAVEENLSASFQKRGIKVDLTELQDLLKTASKE